MASNLKIDQTVERNAGQETQAQCAYREVEQMIVTLALPPGGRISEKTLAAKLDLGRTPVREALQRLAHERTIQILPRSGAIVSHVDIAAHFKLIEVRRELERIMVSRAARLMDQVAGRMFLDLANRFRMAERSNDEGIFISADREFNLLLAQTAANEYATAAMAPLQAQTRRLWYLFFKHFGEVSKVSRLHGDIAEALFEREEQESRQALDALIDYVEDYTYRTINLELTKKSSA